MACRRNIQNPELLGELCKPKKKCPWEQTTQKFGSRLKFQGGSVHQLSQQCAQPLFMRAEWGIHLLFPSMDPEGPFGSR